MIKIKKIICVVLSILLVATMTNCTAKKLTDIRTLTDEEYAVNSLSAVDALGRVTLSGDTESSRDVGIFYFLWLGAHSSGSSVYDVSVLEEENPEALWSPTSSESPINTYHFWGEPLFGYYDSSDPWVLTRHIELFTMSGIDFLMFDVTNGVTYDNVVQQLLVLLDKYQKQGWDVPKIAFMSNTGSYNVINRVYTNYYDENSQYYYPDLWYSPNDKPLICGNKMYFDENSSNDAFMLDFFDLRDTQWPNTPYKDEEAFPWIDWSYPQTNHKGVMSVSVAQHVVSKMSYKDLNWGRAYNQDTFLNESDKVDYGLNFQSQWDTVFNTLNNGDDIDTVFLTGWNEWIAIKFYQNNEVYFVDQFNEEYSRDIELMKGGYGDNYYLQMLNNIKKFKYSAANDYSISQNTIDIKGDLSQWNNIQSYPDFEGDALERNYKGYVSALTYIDRTNRNDIVDIKITHDKTKVYFYVKTLQNITFYENGDTDWMNIWLNFDSNKSGYSYVINRDYGKLYAVNNNNYSLAGDVDINIKNNVMTVAVPLSLMGASSKNLSINFKVSDNVDSSDVMNFYLQGDSAPIGRLNYTYGYFNN